LASSPLPLKVTRVAGVAEPGLRKIDPRGVGIGVGTGVGARVGLALGLGLALWLGLGLGLGLGLCLASGLEETMTSE